MRKEEPVQYSYEKPPHAGSEARTVERHPAFGQASFSRRQGHPGKLYGSNLEDHHTHVALEIKRSELVHDLSHDWFFPGDLLIEVNFSAAQFAELITTLNVGSGVPCTIRAVKGEGYVPAIPEEVRTESERIEESFKQKLKERVGKLREYEQSISEILSKKSIGKKDREQIKNLVYQARRFFVDSAPFAVSSLYEAKEKVVTSAKAEIEAFLTNAIVTAGIKTLKGKSYEDYNSDSDIASSALPAHPDEG